MEYEAAEAIYESAAICITPREQHDDFNGASSIWGLAHKEMKEINTRLEAKK